MIKARVGHFTPLILLLFWMLIVGFLIWKHVAESPQPPLHDAISYIEKAKFFWKNATSGFPENPMNLTQPVRPPGTVLLSYPFGFSEDYRGFLFRSVFVPFMIWIGAIMVLFWPLNRTRREAGLWPVALAAFLLGPFPLFFQFEVPAIGYWGLVDAFLASLAAFAVASAARSLVVKSTGWMVVAALAASFTPLVKPSGGLVLLLTALFWITGKLIIVWLSTPSGRKQELKQWLLGTLTFAITGGLISWVCIHSNYLSPEVVAYFKQSMAILQSDFGGIGNLQFFALAINSIYGPQLMIILIIGCYLVFTAGSDHLFKPVSRYFAVASAAFLAVGCWFWIFLSGISQIRYFYPFALMTITPLLMIAAIKISNYNHEVKTLHRWLATMLCLVPAFNLLGLMLPHNPPMRWQQLSGVSVNTGKGGEGVALANMLLAELKNSRNSAVVYGTNVGGEALSFYCKAILEGTLHPDAHVFTTRLPMDWERPTTYRIPEITTADYILFRPIDTRNQHKRFKHKSIRTLSDEEAILEAFLSSLGPAHGIKTIAGSKKLKLVQITDGTLLTKAFDSLILTKTWRQVFLAENAVARTMADKSKPIVLRMLPPTFDIIFNFDRFNHQKNHLAIAGWAFLKGLDSKALKTFVLVKGPDTLLCFETGKQIRKDITTGFAKDNQNYDSTGFIARISTDGLPEGDYQVGLYLVKDGLAGVIYSGSFIKIEP